MKFIVYDKINTLPILNMEEYALTKTLDELSDCGYFYFEMIQTKIEITEKKFSVILFSLKEKRIISIKRNILNNEEFLEIRFILTNKEELSPIFLNEYNFFDLDWKYLKNTLNETDNNDKKKLFICRNAVEVHQNIEISPQTINSQKDYIQFLENIKPLNIWKINKIKLFLKDAIFVYEKIVEEKVAVAVLNLALDYAITSSKYNNVNFRFVEIILADWKNNKYQNIEEIINYLQVRSTESKYIEPEYEYLDNAVSDQQQNTENFDALLNNAFSENRS